MLVLVAVLGCGHRARVHRPGEVWLETIKIEGNKTLPDDDLIPGLAIERARRDGDRVDPYQLSLDTKRIRSTYLRAGFFEAKVESRIDREDNAEIVVFTVVEGPRTNARVVVTGLPLEVSEDAVLAKLELKTGEPFDYELYDDGKEVVKSMVEDAGYPFVDLDDSVVTVDRKDKVAVASYRVAIGGPRATFGKVTITGLDRYPDLERAIRGRLAFVEGDTYTPRALIDTQRAIVELGRFSEVRIDIDRTKIQPVVPVLIKATASVTTTLKAGGGGGYEAINSERPYQARVRGLLTYIPDDYPLWLFSVDGRLALTFDETFEDREPKVRVFFNGQREELLRPYIVGDAGFGLDVFSVEAYTAYGPILKLNATAPLGVRWLTAQVGWTFSYYNFSSHSDLIDAATEIALGLRGSERDGRFEQVVSADRRDNPLDPRKGLYASLRLSEGTILAGGDYGYLEVQPDVRGYVPIGSRSVLAFHVHGGAFLGTDRIPVTQRLFSGGSQGHRGFGARALAPSVCQGPNDVSFLCAAGSTSARDALGARLPSVLIGGEALLETGAELRITLGALSSSTSWGTTLFVDGGDVTNRLADLDPTHLYWAGGVGVFFKIGGFKIRIDGARRFARIGPDDLNFDSTTNLLWRNSTLILGIGETY